MRSLVAGSTALLLAAQPLCAAPVGGTVTAGSATIQQNGSTTTVTQFGNQAIINWKSFSIGSGETVQFLQPNALAVALNRVTGIDPSVILGSLVSNGRIFLVNPNGVLFGQGSTVDVGGLAVSTLALSDSDFLSGNYTFNQDVNKNLAFIVNQGTIKAANGGYVVLVAPLVDNQGTIVANLGSVGIGAGTGATLNLDSQGLVHVQVLPPSGSAGNVTLPSCASSSLLAQIVNSKGIIPAGQVQQSGNSVTLASASGLAVNAGTITASGSSGQSAGSIAITSTQATVLAPGSLMAANGVGACSNGGHVQALSQGISVFQKGASMSANGGDTGNGGQLELSGTCIVDAGSVSARAPGGKAGNFLIDPSTINLINGTVCSTIGCVRCVGVCVLHAQSLCANICLTAGNKINLKNNGSNTLVIQNGHSITLTAGGCGIVAACGGNAGIVTCGAGNITVVTTAGGPINLTGYHLCHVGTAGTICLLGSGNVSTGNLIDRGGRVTVNAGGNITVNGHVIGNSCTTSPAVCIKSTSAAATITINAPSCTSQPAQVIGHDCGNPGCAGRGVVICSAGSVQVNGSSVNAATILGSSKGCTGVCIKATGAIHINGSQTSPTICGITNALATGTGVKMTSTSGGPCAIVVTPAGGSVPTILGNATGLAPCISSSTGVLLKTCGGGAITIHGNSNASAGAIFGVSQAACGVIICSSGPVTIAGSQSLSQSTIAGNSLKVTGTAISTTSCAGLIHAINVCGSATFTGISSFSSGANVNGGGVSIFATGALTQSCATNGLLTATGLGLNAGSIGTAGNPLRSSTANLCAFTSGGCLMVANTGQPLHISRAGVSLGNGALCISNNNTICVAPSSPCPTIFNQTSLTLSGTNISIASGATISGLGKVTLNASGAIGSCGGIICAPAVTMTAGTTIGAGTAISLGSTSSITATAAGLIHVNDAVAPLNATLTTNNGCVQMTGNGTNVNYSAGSQLLTATGTAPLNLTLKVNCANINMGSVNLPGDPVILQAKGFACGAGGCLKVGTLNLAAGAAGIGSGTTPLHVTACALSASSCGSININGRALSSVANLSSKCGSVNFTLCSNGGSLAIGNVAAKTCASISVSGTSLTVTGPVQVNGKLSLLDPTGLLLVTGTLNANTACLAGLSIGQGATLSAKTVTLTAGSGGISEISNGLVKACTVNLQAPTGSVGTACNPLQVCTANLIADPANTFVKDVVAPTTLKLTTDKGCILVTAPCFKVNFNGSTTQLTGQATKPTCLNLAVTCSNIKIGTVAMPGSTITVTSGSCTSPHSIQCGGGTITAKSVTLHSTACIGTTCAPVKVCSTTLCTHACGGGVHVLNPSQAAPATSGTTTTTNNCTSPCSSPALASDSSTIAVVNSASSTGAAADLSASSACNGLSNSASGISASCTSVNEGCSQGLTTSTTPAGSTGSSTSGSNAGRCDQSLSPGTTPAPTAPGGLLSTPNSASFPAVVPLNNPLEKRFQVMFPEPPLAEKTRPELLPDNKKKNKRSLLRRLFTVQRRRH
ncbi:MAG: two-partner secretion domain-containing protein [Candidatus Xenobia bacterium]